MGNNDEEFDLKEPLLQQEEKHHVGQEVTAAWGSKRWGMTKASYAVLALTLLLDSSEMSVLLPTLYQFLQSTKRNPDSDVSLELGVILSSFSIASLISKPVLGWLGDRTSMRRTFAWSIAVAAIGNVLYSCSAFLAGEYFPQYDSSGETFILVARVLSGIGCANTSLVFAYVARTVKPGERTAAISSLSMIKLVGVFAGPVVTFITDTIDVEVGHFKLDSRNAPGFCIAVLQLLVLVALLVFLKEPISYEKADRMDRLQPSIRHGEEHIPSVTGCSHTSFHVCTRLGTKLKSGMLLCFFVLLYYSFQMSSFQAFATPTAVEVYRWPSTTISLCYLLFTGTAIIGNIIVVLLSGKVKDTSFLLVGAILAILAPIIMKLTFFWDMSPAPTLIVFSLFVAPIPFVFGPSRSIFTRLVEGSHFQGVLSALLSVTSSIGGILGPLLVGWLLQVERPIDGNLHKAFAARISTTYIALGTMNLFVNLVLLYMFNYPSPSKLSAQKLDARHLAV